MAEDDTQINHQKRIEAEIPVIENIRNINIIASLHIFPFQLRLKEILCVVHPHLKPQDQKQRAQRL